MPHWDNLQTIPVVTEDLISPVNTGNKKIHAKRISGRFRIVKWMTASLWLIFFAGPYLRWDERQAILFDIPARQFHLFSLTVHPQDIWVLSFIMLFFATLLLVITMLAGRAFCGYFCFQTVWTDCFTWVEQGLEGSPRDREAMDKAPWSTRKLIIKLSKHSIWLIISILTGVSFTAWFTDAYQLWNDYFTLQAHLSAWIVLLMFTVGTYIFAGFMREQVCFWLCPYSRIQGVMYDNNTLLPTYDQARGEPRTKLNRTTENQRGTCVDCDQCVVVCPTGIDIREGQQIGCITCGLCIDACDSVMDKIKQPRGLIRYGSLNEFHGSMPRHLYQRPLLLVSIVIIFISVTATSYGISTIADAELRVLPNRQSEYILMTDGAIQNSYQLRVFNKSKSNSLYRIEVEGLNNMLVMGNEHPLLVQHGRMETTTLFIKVSHEQLKKKISPLKFRIVNISQKAPAIEYKSIFIGP